MPGLAMPVSEEIGVVVSTRADSMELLAIDPEQRIGLEDVDQHL